MSKIIRKLALLGPGELQLQVQDNDIPLRSEMVKVRVSACGICGSDLSLLKGSRDISKEHYFGHEFSGVVTELGEDSIGFSPGMRVASELAVSCGRCWNCRNGLSNYCRSMNDAFSPGGFTEETLVSARSDYSFLSSIPDSLDDITASMSEPTNCAYRIAMQSNIKPGDNIVIFGLGAMGIISALILKQLGAGAVVCVGRRATRQEKVRKLGIFDAVVGNDDNGMDAIRQIVGDKGADVVIEATGTPQVLEDAIRMVRYGGRVVVGSVYSDKIPEFDPLPIFRKEITIIGAKGPYVYPRTDGSSAVIFMMEKIREDLRKIITVYDYKDALQAFEDASSGEAIKAVVKF